MLTLGGTSSLSSFISKVTSLPHLESTSCLSAISFKPMDFREILHGSVTVASVFSFFAFWDGVDAYCKMVDLVTDMYKYQIHLWYHGIRVICCISHQRTSTVQTLVNKADMQLPNTIFF
jgi:hypothetical protein